GIESGVPGRVQISFHGLVDRLEILNGLIARITLPEEIVGFCGLRRLRAADIYNRDLEPFGQIENRVVRRIDQLTAMFRYLPVLPGGRVGMHAATRAPRGFVDGREDTGILQRERRGQTCDAATDYGDSWSGFGNSLSRPCGQ